jgi:beta-methylmalyl-CoA/(S)-malyl-CoA lyase
MIVPAHKPDEVMRYADFNPDVAVLDLEYTVPPKSKDTARSGLKQLMKSLGESHGDVFVRIDRDARWADAAAAVQRGVKGIVFPGAEEPDEVRELAGLVAEKEREHAVEPGSIELALILESAKGFWNADALAMASARVMRKR